jgi:hypothetical protein
MPALIRRFASQKLTASTNQFLLDVVFIAGGSANEDR